MKRLLDGLLHIFEFGRELLRPGELGEWRRIDPRTEAKLMKRAIPKDSSCYPYHAQLDRRQLVHPEDFGHPGR